MGGLRKKGYGTLISFVLFVASVTLLTSGGAPETEESAGVPQAATTLALLADGQFAGMIVGFNPSNPPATEESIRSRWEDALAAGMRVGRLQIDWGELEPRRGEYDRGALEDRLLAYREQSLQTFLLISVYDSGGPVLPEYLEGRRLDSSTVIRRFNRLMDWVIPMLVAYDGYMISVINEADNSFGEVPGLEEEVLTFLIEAKGHIRTLDERIAVAATVAEGNLGGESGGIRSLIEASDVATFNFYGARFEPHPPYYVPQSASEIRSDIRRMLEVSGDKQIVIQELGMFSGSERLGSDGETQRRFFEVFFEEMERQERVRAAYVFQLVDWSEEVTAILAEPLRAETVPEDFVQAFSESLETVGLIRYEDGSSKPAWHEFLRWVERFSRG